MTGARFSFGTSGVTHDPFRTEMLSVSARVAPRLVMADPSRIPGLEGLKRDIAIEAGLSASLEFGQF